MTEVTLYLLTAAYNKAARPRMTDIIIIGRQKTAFPSAQQRLIGWLAGVVWSAVLYAMIWIEVRGH